jgi:tetratricopeptide (TPR) repeat protein
LQERSLVVAEEVHEALRFRLLETVRQYSLERLNASSEADAMRARHLTYYRQFVETLASKQVGGAPGNALDRLERERENLQAALSHAVEARETESGLRVASILWRFWLLRGYVGEGREQMNLLLAQDTDVPASVRAEALNGAGVLAQSQSDYTAARTLHEESLRLYQDAGEQQGMANVLSNLAMLAYNQRGYPEAAKRFRDCLQLHRELGNRRGIASSLLNLGNIALRRHDYTAARALYEESLAVPRYPGDGQNVAIALLNLGSVYLLLEDHPAARTRLQECLKGCRDLQYREGIASALEAFASLAAAEGEGARAGRLAGAADALRGEFNLPRSPDEAAELTEALSPARQMLDEAAFAAALAEGGRMPWEQAVEYALAPTSFVAEQDNPRG